MTSESFKNTGGERNACRLSEASYSLLADESVKWQDKVPIGIKFKPNDQVLVCDYLAGKVNGFTDGPIFPLIKEVDVFQHEPSQLSRLSYDFCSEKMYFFTRLKKQSEREMSVDKRVPAGGVWKEMGKPSYVKGKDGKRIATKTTLVYCKKGLISKKDRWLMKEYRLLDGELLLKQTNYEESWKLCIVYYYQRKKRKRIWIKKNVILRKYGQFESKADRSMNSKQKLNARKSKDRFKKRRKRIWIQKNVMRLCINK